MSKKFHHLSLFARDSQKNLDFYRNLLGLRLVKQTVNHENHQVPHYFYGDYSGTPGSIISFFILPRLGHRYDESHYLATIGLKIPRDSLAFWAERLRTQNITYRQSGTTLAFQDPDGVDLLLKETTEPPLLSSQQVKNEIPHNKQILGLTSTEFHVSDPKKTEAFFQEFLDWPAKNQRVFLNQTDFFDILPTASEKKSRLGQGSMDHVAFSVEDDQELESLYQKAKKQGWTIERYVNRGYFNSLYIREPGGNRVEFATLTPGFTFDEPLETLGEQISPPPLFPH